MSPVATLRDERGILLVCPGGRAGPAPGVRGSSVWESQAVDAGHLRDARPSASTWSAASPGVFSLGHIGFMALGVYISAILTLSLEKKAALLPDLPGWLAGVSSGQMIGPVPARLDRGDAHRGESWCRSSRSPSGP